MSLYVALVESCAGTACIYVVLAEKSVGTTGTYVLVAGSYAGTACTYWVLAGSYAGTACTYWVLAGSSVTLAKLSGAAISMSPPCIRASSANDTLALGRAIAYPCGCLTFSLKSSILGVSRSLKAPFSST